MRKLSLHLLSLFAAVSMFTMTSCTSEEDVVDPAPTVTIPNTAVSSAKVGDKVAFNVSIVAQAKIKSIETRLGTTTLGTVKTSDFTNSTSDSYPFEYTVQQADAGKTLQFAFIVTDSKERTAKTDYTLTVGATGSVRIQNQVLLYGQANTAPGEGSFYGTEGTGKVYMQSEAKTNAAKIDFLYFYSSTDLATIAAPSDTEAKSKYNNPTTGLQTWGDANLNNTKFKELTMTKADFDAATFTSIETATTGATLTKVNKLAAAKVFGFITAGGKKGIVYINSVEGNTIGKINITVKIADADTI